MLGKIVIILGTREMSDLTQSESTDFFFLPFFPKFFSLWFVNLPSDLYNCIVFSWLCCKDVPHIEGVLFLCPPTRADFLFLFLFSLRGNFHFIQHLIDSLRLFERVVSVKA